MRTALFFAYYSMLYRERTQHFTQFSTENAGKAGEKCGKMNENNIISDLIEKGRYDHDK